MTQLTKLVNGVRQNLTTLEISTRSAEEIDTLAGLVYSDWMNEIRALDVDMPRYIEDMMNAMGVNNFPEIMQERYNAKQDMRAEKPVL